MRLWVLKVDAGGFESLRDGRGRKMSEDELALMMGFRTSFSSLVKYHHGSIFIYGYTL